MEEQCKINRILTNISVSIILIKLLILRFFSLWFNVRNRSSLIVLYMIFTTGNFVHMLSKGKTILFCSEVIGTLLLSKEKLIYAVCKFSLIFLSLPVCQVEQVECYFVIWTKTLFKGKAGRPRALNWSFTKIMSSIKGSHPQQHFKNPL